MLLSLSCFSSTQDDRPAVGNGAESRGSTPESRVLQACLMGHQPPPLPQQECKQCLTMTCDPVPHPLGGDGTLCFPNGAGSVGGGYVSFGIYGAHRERVGPGLARVGHNNIVTASLCEHLARGQGGAGSHQLGVGPGGELWGEL